MRKLILIVICAYSLSPALAQDEPISRFEKVVNRMVKAINEGKQRSLPFPQIEPVTAN